MRLEWSHFALEDRIGIFEYIAKDSVQAAIEVDGAIGRQTRRLSEFPRSGRPGRVLDARELVVVGYPYVIAYRVEGEAVRILRVLHGARRWPDSMPR